MMFREKLSQNKFVITAEICPPKGPVLSPFLKKAKALKGKVDAVNITDNQRAIMRMSALACAIKMMEEGIEPILQITCRDRNRIALQSDLLGAAGAGIKNVLALTGDYITEGDHKQAKPVFDLDSAQLVKTIKTLNNGIDLSGRSLNGKTDFFIGAAVNPCAEPGAPHMISFEKKVEAGAEYFQTQAIFDIDKFVKFMDFTKNFPVKVLGGILLVKSAKMARFLNDNVPGIYVPADVIEKFESSKDPIKTGVEIARRQIEQFKQLCAGAHIMTVGNEELVPEILK